MSKEQNELDNVHKRKKRNRTLNKPKQNQVVTKQQENRSNKQKNTITGYQNDEYVVKQKPVSTDFIEDLERKWDDSPEEVQNFSFLKKRFLSFRKKNYSRR